VRIADWYGVIENDSLSVKACPEIIFPLGEMMIKACAIVVAIVLALGASGCGSRQQAIAEAKSGNGTVPKSRLIMATLN
jgi:hypothetical protein